MKVTVCLFAAVREMANTSVLTMELPVHAPASMVLESLMRSYPAIRAYQGYLRIAVNREYVGETHLLEENDEIAVIPPVSGG